MNTATLLELVTNIRHEIGEAPGFSQGISAIPSLKYLCQRVQQELYQAFNWPHLLVDIDETLVPGERYYTFNNGLNRDRILEVFVRWSNSWMPVAYGFDPLIYNASIPEESYRTDPIRKWKFYASFNEGTQLWEDNQYEVWPAPATAQTLRWSCVRNLRPLVADADVCEIDSNLIVLTVAAELLTRLKSNDAQAKNATAQALLTKLKGQMMPSQTFTYGGDHNPANRQRPMWGRKI